MSNQVDFRACIEPLKSEQLWHLGDLISVNADHCKSVGIEKYQIRQDGKYWVLEVNGDWHSDSEVPLRSESRPVFEAFVHVVKSGIFEEKSEGTHLEHYQVQRANAIEGFTQDDDDEIGRIQQGYGNPIFTAIPIPDWYTIESNGQTFSICLLGQPLKYLEKIQSQRVAQYVHAAAILQMLPGTAYDDAIDERPEQPTEPVEPDWL